MPPRFEKNLVIGNPNEYRPTASLDVLLQTLRLTGVIQTSIELSAPWGCDLPQEADEVLLYLVLAGECFAYSDGKPNSIQLSGGDALLVPVPQQHALADSLKTPLEPLENFTPSHLKTAESPNDFLAGLFGTSIHYGGGGKMTLIITLRFYIDKNTPRVLFKTLGGIIPLYGFINENRFFLEHLLFQIASYGKEGFTGQTIATRLAESVLLVAIRAYLEKHSKGRSNAYRGWNDPFLSKVFGAIHDAPEIEWNIHELAARSGMSRSAFIKRFSNVVGQPPKAFILSIRMDRAAELLENSEKSLTQIASMVGYGSEAAFSRAFHRWSGMTPGAARKRRKI